MSAPAYQIINDTLGIQVPATKPHHRSKFSATSIDDVRLTAEPAWSIRQLLPARGLACIIGAPKSGKSFALSDALFAVSRGVPFAGRETLQGPVFYCTGEGVTGFKRRLIAMRQRHKDEGNKTPFFMIESVPDLGSERTDLSELFKEIDAVLETLGSDTPRVVALDTVARCMGDGDENSARDMGRLIARCSEIETRYRCLVALVHHVGKDPTRGGRGSNSLNAAADVTIEIVKRDGINRGTVIEMKDGPEGTTWTFGLASYRIEPLGTGLEPNTLTSDASGESLTCVVEILSEAAMSEASETKRRRALTGVNGHLLKVIKKTIEEMGETETGCPDVPPTVRAARKENLKNYCRTMAWQDIDGKPDAFRSMLSKGLSDLSARDMIGQNAEWVWLI